MIDIIYFLQVFGSLLAIMGAVYNCSTHVCDKATGFAVWVVSNSVLMLWACLVGAYWIALMYVAFLCTSTYGFWYHRRLV